MQPAIHLNWLAILVSVVASFAIGSIWYGVLFRAAWFRAMEMDQKPATGAEMAKGSVLNVIGLLLVAFVLSHDVAVWRPSTWGLAGDAGPAVYGFFTAVLVWLGYVLPTLLNGVAFERKRWSAFFIGAGAQLVSLMAMAMILSFWR